MFRFNNPDALLTLLLVAAAYGTLRAVESGRTRWLVLAGALIGIGFLTKMLQAFLVVPAFAAAWLLAAPVTFGRRVRDLALATVALVVAGGWWVLVVELWPADSRPFIGGSQTNSVLELVFGCNGFGRLTGNEVGSVGGGAGGRTGGWGETGLTRLFDAELGGQASWLLPAAMMLLVVLLWSTRRAPRTDRLRAATVVWGGWLLVTAAVFSLMAGIFHPYYLVALAPAIAALVGIGTVTLWRRRAAVGPRAILAVLVALTVGWSFVLLGRTPHWQPWLAPAVLVVGVVAAVALLVVHRLPYGPAAVVAVVAVVVSLAGTGGYALATAAVPHTGAIPSAGPQRSGFPLSGLRLPGLHGIGGKNRADHTPGPGPRRSGIDGQVRWGLLGGSFGGLATLLDSPAVSPDADALLERDAADYTWVAATVGSNSAAGYQLATGSPVMAVGGFNGTDPFPTLEGFQQLVAGRKVHWFVGGAGPDDTASGGSDEAIRIATWVASRFTPVTVDGRTLYDLTKPAAP
jgi:4-amino-4-deoxy-L-arabinose transferase-like glycosyltransferase